VGGVVGFFVGGPEGAAVGAIGNAARTSAGQVLVVFAELWFGVG
jgi:hypothetical protein